MAMDEIVPAGEPGGASAEITVVLRNGRQLRCPDGIIEIARPKKSCRRCEKMVQAPAPTRPIPGSMASAALLAYILVSKFDDHLPLYRLAEIFTRMGADIPDSTLVDWCGRAMKVLKPLIDRIEAEIMASDLLHADDTPIRVLDRSLRDRGLGKGVKKGRVWTYVRDQRPWAGAAPPGAVYRFAPDWKEEHVRTHLQKTEGILQGEEDQPTVQWTVGPTNGYKGYTKLYDPGPDGAVQLRETACWAHLRRDFHDVWTSTGSAIAREALDRIGALYDIERSISGQPAEVRRTVRQEQSKPKVEAFRNWAEQQLTRRRIASRVTACWRSCGLMARARVSAPVSAPAKSQFFRPIPMGRRARSVGLLSMATRPSSRNRQNDGQRLRP
jgi:transposase